MTTKVNPVFDDDDAPSDASTRRWATGPTVQSTESLEREFAARGEYLAHRPASINSGPLAEPRAAIDQQLFLRSLAPVNRPALLSAETLYNLYLLLRRLLGLSARAVEAVTQGPAPLLEECSDLGLLTWAKGVEAADALNDAAAALESDPDTWTERTMRDLAMRLRAEDSDLDGALTHRTHRPGYKRPELKNMVVAAYEQKYGSLSQAVGALRSQEERFRAIAETTYPEVPPGLPMTVEDRERVAAKDVLESSVAITPPGLAAIQQAITREYAMFVKFQDLGPDHIAVSRNPNLPPAL